MAWLTWLAGLLAQVLAGALQRIRQDRELEAAERELGARRAREDARREAERQEDEAERAAAAAERAPEDPGDPFLRREP